MYVIDILGKDGEIDSQLQTNNSDTAKAFIQSELDRIYYDETKQILGLFVEGYGYYCKAIPHRKEFEIVTLQKNKIEGNQPLYYTKDILINRLDEGELLEDYVNKKKEDDCYE